LADFSQDSNLELLRYKISMVTFMLQQLVLTHAQA